MSSIPLSFRKKTPEPILSKFPPSSYKDYIGPIYKPPEGWWAPHLQIDYDSPIHYLEIGTFYGIHAIKVSEKLTNADSKIYCIDPWEDYDQYTEYKGKQNTIWNSFNENLSKCENKNKFEIHRGFSDNIVPTFPDNYFDIIYVDGNHETEYVYRDGCMSFQKLKKGGYMIFDDYDWPQTKVGIDRFMDEYKPLINIIGGMTPDNNSYQQYIVQKL
jgi:predicted O-methyltransferase YrrM